jgi:PTS system glucose-specific IIA component
MGMFKKLFTKTEPISRIIELKAHVSGNIVKLEDVPDPVFAEKMMGEGIAIEPTEGTIVSPVDGEIIQVFPTKHALGIKTCNHAEILIHIGLETVSMGGEGFTVQVAVGEKVKVGDVLVIFDLDLVKERTKSTVTPIIITNTAAMERIVKPISTGRVVAGNSEILTVVAK